MDHIEQNIQDVMDQYTPKVPPHRYNINFVPAVDKTSTDIKMMLLYDIRYVLKMLLLIAYCKMHGI